MSPEMGASLERPPSRPLYFWPLLAWLFLLLVHLLAHDGGTATLNRALGALLALPAIVLIYRYLILQDSLKK